MILKHLTLTNFRNFERLDFTPAAGINIIVGANAQGKSNLLESIQLLTTAKSPKTTRDRELVKFDEPGCIIQARLNRANRGATEIQLRIEQTKQIIVNGVKKNRVAELIGEVNTISFSPDDLQIIKGEPKDRRWFLNFELSQLSRQYYYNLLQYHRVLIQRNKLLKNIKSKDAAEELLAPWDAQLINFGTRIIEKRHDLISKLDQRTPPLHRELTNQKENLEIKYQSQVKLSNGMKAIAQDFQTQLHQARDHELLYGRSLVGPHLDDFLCLLNGFNLKTFGSQGQKRSAAFAIKLAQFFILKEQIGESPILLLDDILSELDDQRRHYLFRLFEGVDQLFLTTTSLDAVPAGIKAQATIFEISEGKIGRNTI